MSPSSPCAQHGARIVQGTKRQRSAMGIMSRARAAPSSPNTHTTPNFGHPTSTAQKLRHQSPYSPCAHHSNNSNAKPCRRRARAQIPSATTERPTEHQQPGAHRSLDAWACARNAQKSRSHVRPTQRSPAHTINQASRAVKPTATSRTWGVKSSSHAMLCVGRIAHGVSHA